MDVPSKYVILPLSLTVVFQVLLRQKKFKWTDLLFLCDFYYNIFLKYYY